MLSSSISSFPVNDVLVNTVRKISLAPPFIVKKTSRVIRKLETFQVVFHSFYTVTVCAFSGETFLFISLLKKTTHFSRSFRSVCSRSPPTLVAKERRKYSMRKGSDGNFYSSMLNVCAHIALSCLFYLSVYITTT